MTTLVWIQSVATHETAGDTDDGNDDEPIWVTRRVQLDAVPGREWGRAARKAAMQPVFTLPCLT